MKTLLATTHFLRWPDRIVAETNPASPTTLRWNTNWHMKQEPAMTTRLHEYDVANHLRTPEEMAAYLDAAIAESNGDASFIAMALGDIARAKGMAELSRDTGLGRESLYKALSANGNPHLSTVLKVANALKLQLHVKPMTNQIE